MAALQDKPTFAAKVIVGNPTEQITAASDARKTHHEIRQAECRVPLRQVICADSPVGEGRGGGLGCRETENEQGGQGTTPRVKRESQLVRICMTVVCGGDDKLQA